MKMINFIAVFVLIPVILICTTYTVIPNGTGDFTTITAALAFVVNGDIIIVYEGTYYENVTISNNITLRGRGEGYTATTIVDGSQNPTGTIITVNASLSDVIIQGLTIQSNTTASGKGVLIRNSDVTLTECIIRNIKWGINVNGSTFPYHTPVIEDNKICNNLIGILCNSLVWPDIIGNEIYSNSENGIRLFGDIIPPAPDANVNISNNVLYHHDGLNGKAIFSYNVSLDLDSNLIHDNCYAIYTAVEPDYVNLTNDTVCDNRYFINDPNDMDITNCIIWDNEFFLPTPFVSFYTINYSCIQQTNVQFSGGIGVIMQDPLFVSSADYTLKWTETDKSPCIDTGDPNYVPDPDGTRADMGAYYHPHDVKTYRFPDNSPPINGWKWLCFDILDRTLVPYNIADYMLDPIKAEDLLDYALFKDHGSNTTPQPIEYNWGNQTWQNGDHPFTSPYGYKFHTWNVCSLEIPGFRCEATTTFFVAGENEENWIGYYLNRTQHVYDSFVGHLDNIYSIKTQYWSVENEGGGWPDVPYTLNPGDMVIVKCYEDIDEFCWVNQQPAESFIIEEPQSFSYEEEADYIPIYMSLDPEDLPTEIGAFVDGECQGATVVQDTSAQICAYIMANQGSSLEFEFYYGGRAENKVIREYNVYDPETSRTEKGSILIGNNRNSYYVSFKNESASTPAPARLEASNYPNPFNPVTTITYSLPEDSQISISIYNIKGQEVKSLVTGTQPAGSYNISWNGKDESGKDVTSGIYFYKLRTQNNETTRKMLLLK